MTRVVAHAAAGCPCAVALLVPSVFARGEPAVRQVVRVVDGDTIELDCGEIVRLIGLDTPETGHPNRPAKRFGKRHRPSLVALRREGEAGALGI